MYNRRFYEYGGDTMQPDSSGQGIMQAAPQSMQQPPLADQAQGQDQQQIKDPQHALQIIIQMLVAQGIPPEQAKQIAMEMIKAVAEGGMQEVTSDEKVHARFGGHITREHYLFGGIGRSIGKIVGGVGKAVSGVVKGVANAVKSVAGSNLGKLALLAAAVYFGGPLLAGEAAAGTTAAAGTAAGTAAATEAGLAAEGLGSSLLYSPTAAATLPGASITAAAPYGSSLLPTAGLTQQAAAAAAPSLWETAQAVASNPSLSGIQSLGSQALSSMIPSSITDAALKYGPSIAGGILGGSLAGGMPQQQPGESNADYQARVEQWKTTLNTGMSGPTFNQGAFPNNPFYSQYARKAEGGRIGYETGGISNIIGQATREGFFGTPMMADGGRINYGFGSLAKSSGVFEPVSSGDSSGIASHSGFGGMGLLGRLISQHPEMFAKTSSKDFMDANADGIDDRMQAAYGGRMGYRHGNVPTGKPRQNQHGVNEIDYRDNGGYVPPIGVKEKADDIPAMLSNNEFVFTADAVRNAGRGDVNKGAQRMYKLMKHLEAGGVVA